MKKNIYILFTLILIFGCKDSEQTYYENNGVRFTCPNGWKIEDKDEGEDYFFVTMQKDGLTSSGTIRVSCIYDSIDNKSLIQELQNNFKSNTIYKDLEIQFDSISTYKYNNIDCIQTPFKFDWWGDIDQGKYMIFNGRNKTIAVLIQEAAKHHDINKFDFKLFEESFFID